MGDRGNIVVHFNENDPPLYFYAHYDGSDLPVILQDALKRGKPRWDDAAYLARIIFCELIKGDVLGLTGYGLSLFMCDNEHRVLHVFLEQNTIMVDSKEWTFQEYVDLPNLGGWTPEELVDGKDTDEEDD